MNEISVDLIDPGGNVRFATGDVTELADSISKLGIVVPLVVRPQGKRFEIVAGHRRFAAAQKIGLESVPASVRDISDEDLVAFMLAENIQRKEMTHIEIGSALVKLKNQGYTQAEIAGQIGKSVAFVSNHLRLMDLPKKIRDKVHQKRMGLWEALGYDKAPSKQKNYKKPTGSNAYSDSDDDDLNAHGTMGGPQISGAVFVVVGLRFGLEPPAVAVCTTPEAAAEQRHGIGQKPGVRRAVICPVQVHGDDEEEAS